MLPYTTTIKVQHGSMTTPDLSMTDLRSMQERSDVIVSGQGSKSLYTHCEAVLTTKKKEEKKERKKPGILVTVAMSFYCSNCKIYMSLSFILDLQMRQKHTF